MCSRELKKWMPLFFAVLIVVALLFGGIVSHAATLKNGHSKSKTATDLDKNFISTVRLALPSAEETLVSDIVFVVDKSSCGKEASQKAEAMVEELLASIDTTKAEIKVGAIVFGGEAKVTFDLAVLNEGNIAEFKSKAFVRPDPLLSGTNMHAGLLAAEKMLGEDTGVQADRKHIILISDGITRLFNVNGEVMNIYYKLRENQDLYYGIPSTWCHVREVTDGVYEIPSKAPFDGTWDTYMNVVKGMVLADGNSFEESFVTYGNFKLDPPFPEKYIDYGQGHEHAMCMDRAIYDAYETYKALVAKNYNFYALYVSEQNKDFVIGKKFMSVMNDGAEIDFNSIKNDILYLLDKGTRVVDVIGQGIDDKGNPYNFDFVDDINQLVLTVGANELSKTKLDESAHVHATSVYGFGELTGGEYPFELRYYKNGEDGVSEECFIWFINVPITNFERATLDYKVKLTNPQAPQVRDMTYKKLLTNVEAILYPIDSAGYQGEPEEFEKPEVQYMVKGTGLNLIVRKEWVLDDGGKATDSVKVVLYKDGNPFGAPVELNEGNGWTNGWSGLDPDATWTVDEVEVPKGFKKHIEGKDLDFIIKNDDEKSTTTTVTKTTETTTTAVTTSTTKPRIPSTGENTSQFILIGGLLVASGAMLIVLKKKSSGC